MAMIQQSIQIRVPVQVAYDRLARFEDYPQFMEEVESVQQIDDRHLHWKTIMANRGVEWDAEITEQEPGRCIAWHNTSGPTNTGKVEMQPVDGDTSLVTFTLRAEPQQVPGSMAGNTERDMQLRLKMDLARMKDFIEGQGAQARSTSTGSEAGQETGPVADLGVSRGTGQSGDKSAGIGVDQVASLGTEGTSRGANRPQEAAPSAQGGQAASEHAPAASDTAGTEIWSYDEGAGMPMPEVRRTVAALRNDSAGSVSPRQNPPQSVETESRNPQAGKSTQSDNSLSRASSRGGAGDGRYSVAEEVNLDQQSDAMRHVGQMPQDTGGELQGEIPTSDSVGKAMQQGMSQDAEQQQVKQQTQQQGAQQEMPDTKSDEELQKSIKRSVPPL
ncbi:SRPBCC family protein [Noviherbaspirillum massiliense]|uniref:SRPBCC family protein n=1 Tax=Noviherbaspirillum massiliense TaxID=1465823 RepID=UPI00036DB8C6|nr:SRPBCC family protein [Noviherbaspirillum massiliense]